MDRSSEYQVAFLIAFGTIVILLLVVAIVLFVIFHQRRILQAQLKHEQMETEYQQKMLLAALESQENERKRLAADLHDGIGSMLSAIRLSLSAISKTAGNQTISHTKSMLDETMESVRKLSRDLLPSTLEKFGLNYAVKELCEQYERMTGLPVKWAESGDPKSLPKTDEVMIFRIVQELLNNAMKHAHATTVRVDIRWNTILDITVTDDGIGFTPDPLAGGLGLFNMQNRARLLGATLDFKQNYPNGTIVNLRVVI